MIGLGLSLWQNTAAMSGAAPPAAGSTWNPLSTGTAPSSADYTFGGGNLVATRASGSGDSLVRDATPNTAGYFEVTVNTASGNNSIGIVAAATVTNAFCGSDASSYGYYGAGQILNNGGNTGATPVASYGALTVGVCIKAGKLYFALIGSGWQAGGDPSAGTGGIDISTVLGSGLYPAASSSGNSVFTLNTGASAFLGTLPTGVSAWG